MTTIASSGLAPQQSAPQQAVIQNAVRYLLQNYTPKGNKVGWLMMASILVEAWDLYSIAFVLVFIREQYNPSPLALGLAAAGTQGGALVGAMIGGWLSDKIGRRVMFLITMIMFVVLALAQAFVSNIAWLIAIRFLLGVHVRRWRGAHARRYRDIPGARHQSRDGLARHARAGCSAGADHPVPAP